MESSPQIKWRLSDANTVRAAVTKPESDHDVNVPQGLCASCVHAQRITSSKGSSFVLCRLSYTDARFPRYPRLPILACDGYLPERVDSEKR
jgi:hypothetical protein